MRKENEILSDIIVWSKYAKYIDSKQRRETWDELVTRNKTMHLNKFPHMHATIDAAYEYVYDKKVLPSMRSLQFGGKAIEVNPVRLFNCSFLPIDHYKAFSETMFLLLSGTGVGYSVQDHNISQLPAIYRSEKSKKYLISDNIEGWADAIKLLMKSYLGLNNWKPKFDYRAIRAKGERLITSGGVAPGPEPLKICLTHIEAILDRKKDGEKLTSIDCHDILCHIADAVLSGGIRRSAMISLFDLNDQAMITCKFGEWHELNPQRGRANNSAVIERSTIAKDEFLNLWKKVELSNSGEPGLYFTNDVNLGTNPCCFTGDMKLLTSQGYKKFEDLSKEEGVQLINKNGETVDGLVWSTGKKQVCFVTLNNGKQIECTHDHKFMLSDGQECEAKDLKGKRIMPYYVPNKEINEFVKLGFIQGDGHTGRLKSESHQGLEIYFGEKDQDVAEIFGFNDTGKKYVNGFNTSLKVMGFSSNVLPEREIPTGYYHLSDNEKKSFLKGMYSANGSVITTSRIAYKTTCLELANELMTTLQWFGLSPYITTNKAKVVEFANGNYECKESYDINIGQIKDIIWFAENIGFVHEYKMNSLNYLISRRAPFVTSVIGSGIKEVFDFNLDDDTHWGVVEGVIAHNCEISLNPFQFCNLVEINASDIDSQKELEKRTWAAAVIGTLQASYTDFHYLRSDWKKTTEREALLGIGMTGIASGAVSGLDLEAAAKVGIDTNVDIADRIGVNRAARVNCVKPSGTTSLVLGTSSGIHAWHDEYYIRRIRVGKNEALYTYLSIRHPELLEDDVFNPTGQAVISIPQMAPEGSITRKSEDAIAFLDRIKDFHQRWIQTGHIEGENTHNVSATVTMNKEEWPSVGEWIWANKDSFNGLSFMPEDLGSYFQTPFETIDKETYDKLMLNLHEIDVTEIIEISDNTSLMDQSACAGNNCEIK